MTDKLFSVEDIPRRKFLELGLKGGIALAATPALLRGALAGQAPPRPEFALEDLNKVIRRALAKGGEFGEVYIENRISRSILLEEGKFKSAVFGISQGAGVRVISGDKTGYAYTDDLTVEALPARGRRGLLRRPRRQGREAGRYPGGEAAVLHHGPGPAPDGGRREAPGDHEAGPRRGPRLRRQDQDGLDRLLRRGPRPRHRQQRRPLPDGRAAAHLLHRPDPRRRATARRTWGASA